MTRIPSTRPRRLASGALALAGGLLMAWSGAQAQDTPSGTDLTRRAIHVCAACHGDGGRSATAAYPHLAGQSALYTIRQLKDFRSQQRAETDSKAYMWGVSALLDDETIQSLADYYAAQAPAPGHNQGEASLRRAGQKIFEQGIPSRSVRACAGCHGTKAEGAAGFPRLAGQHADYLARQLDVFGTRLRPHGVLMKDETAGLTKTDRRAVALYLQSL